MTDTPHVVRPHSGTRFSPKREETLTQAAAWVQPEGTVRDGRRVVSGGVGHATEAGSRGGAGLGEGSQCCWGQRRCGEGSTAVGLPNATEACAKMS